MVTTRAKVIINPAAGANSTFRKWPRIKSLLERIGLSFDPEYTEAPGHFFNQASGAECGGLESVNLES